MLTCNRCGGGVQVGSAACPHCGNPAAPAYPVGQPQGVWQCPFCRYQGPPIDKSKTSTAGWVVFFILLLTTCILCWIGFFLTEQYRVCAGCGTKVG